MPQITGTVRLYSVNPKICRHDNLTHFCAKGYQLSQLGFCLSQSLGKWNSTGFEPLYPICFVDYTSKLDSRLGIQKISTVTAVGQQDVVKDPSFGSVVGGNNIYGHGPQISSLTRVVQDSGQVPGSHNTFVCDIVSHKTVDIFQSPVGSVGVYALHQAGKNIVQHVAGSQSDYWVVDTFGNAVVRQDWSSLEVDYSLVGVSGPQGIIVNTTTSGRVHHPYRAITGTFQLPQGLTLASGVAAQNRATICVDDLTAPTVSGVAPLPFSHLNATSAYVELTVSDAVAGVDLGVLSVVVSGTLTVQPGGRLVVSSGTDHSGGRTSIYGDILQYTVRYTPSVPWAGGERVRVTVSGQDLEPSVGVTPWTCYVPGTRNLFNAVYDFYVAATKDMVVSITADPDTEAPFLTNVYPQEFSRDNSVFSSVQFDVVDSVSGVDISTLDVTVDGAVLIVGGSRQTSEVSITPIGGGFRILYTPSVPFSYGREIFVVVSAKDMYPLADNILQYQYFFSTIGWGSLSITDVLPLSDTSLLAETAYVSARVVDTSFGILDTYVLLNGTTYSGSRTPVYGNLEISTALSGTTTACMGFLRSTTVSSGTIVGTTISGTSLYGGTISIGQAAGGFAETLSSPFALVSGTLVSGTILSGVVVSGTVIDALVSGTNWDGKFVDATVSGVGINFLTLSNTCVSGTTLSGEIGFDISVHPGNDFYFAEPVRTVIYGINRNYLAPVIRNEVFTLYYGYRLLENKYEMRHGERVSVFSRAVNTELLRNSLAETYSFTVGAAPYKDLPASIIVKVPWSDLSATIDIHSPTHSYGELIDVEFYIEDKAGNAFGPYVFQYTIEEG